MTSIEDASSATLTLRIRIHTSSSGVPVLLTIREFDHQQLIASGVLPGNIYRVMLYLRTSTSAP